jgi:hyperosmotically inducible periplasmic protein
MYTQSRKLMLAISLALATTGVSSLTAAGTTAENLTEARQETQIWTTYALSPYLRANDLKVSVHEGKATLTGKVDEDTSKDLAKQIALGVEGIKDVDNQIIVDADYAGPMLASGRSYGEMVDDATITASVKSKLAWSKYADSSTTRVQTKAGKVTLQGTANSAAAKKLAGNLAMSTRGVDAVDNQLNVITTKDSTALEGKYSFQFGQDAADGWITTKVKSTYMYSANVAGPNISVNTKNGIVTLSGKVDSGVERALAIELAQNVRGVKSVEAKGLTF